MLGESEVKDDDGNIIISPGLKVRHKSSQYEYTVDNVVQDPGGEVQVILRMPEDPRFEPPAEAQAVMQDSKDSNNVLYEVDPEGLYMLDPEDAEFDPSQEAAGPEDLLAVPQSEFEKEYEVK
jgi:hypothetical protein